MKCTVVMEAEGTKTAYNQEKTVTGWKWLSGSSVFFFFMERGAMRGRCWCW